jgi:hypothetical protein
MARFERVAIVAVCSAAAAACNLLAGIDQFHDVDCDRCGADAADALAAPFGPDAPFASGDETGAASAMEAGSDDASDAADAFDGTADAAPDAPAGDMRDASDTGPPDTGPAIDYAWARWRMPNGADSGLPNPAQYGSIAGMDGGVLDTITGLQWGPVVTGIGSLDAGVSACSPARVPTRIELVSILDTSQSPLLVNPAFASLLSKAPTATFLTSSTAQGGLPWTITFTTGVVHPSAGATAVLCVQSSGATGGTP